MYCSPLFLHSSVNSGVFGQPEVVLGELSVCHQTAMPILGKITLLAKSQYLESCGDVMTKFSGLLKQTVIKAARLKM